MAKSKAQHPPITAIGYGNTGSGKTRWAATWPRPMFISTGVERGYDTVEGMKLHCPDAFFEKNRPPINRYVYSAEEALAAWDEATELVKSGEVQTIVQDSLSMYSVLYVNHLKDSGFSGYDLWGKLADHIQNLVISAQKLPANILWMCQASDPTDVGAAGGIFMEGRKTTKVLPPLVSNQLYFRTKMVTEKVEGKSKKTVRYEIHTKKCGAYDAKVRLNPNIESPMVNSTYRDFVKALGY